MTEVLLSWHEVAIASHVGWMRQIASLKSGLRDQHGYSGCGWTEHCEGACGELVVAKTLGIYWDGSVNTFKNPDLPGNIDVRTRSRDDYELIVRPNDNDHSRFVLVTGRCPKYRIVGWLHGDQAKQPEWLKNHGGRESAYFVPHSELQPIETLRTKRILPRFMTDALSGSKPPEPVVTPDLPFSY